jgi:tRNA threonylcarbamoyladenosine biosynthesis protein TsaB
MKTADARQPGLVLGIETATVLGGAALVSRAGELIGEVGLRNQESHSERILPACEWLLKTLGSPLQELAAVAVSCGPGSFTGLRSGIATAKGLAFALGVPLFGVPTLEALAANASPGPDPVCAVLNARRGELYFALFRPGPAAPVRIGPDSLAPAGALAGELPAGCLVLGEVAALQPVRDPGTGSLRFAPPHLNRPRAAAVAFLGSVALADSRDSELQTLLPRYLRPWDAEPVRIRG